MCPVSNYALARELNELTLLTLQKLCKSLKLVSTGRKEVLVERVLEFADPVMRRTVIKQLDLEKMKIREEGGEPKTRKRKTPDSNNPDSNPRVFRSLLPEFNAAATASSTVTPAAARRPPLPPMAPLRHATTTTFNFPRTRHQEHQEHPSTPRMWTVPAGAPAPAQVAFAFPAFAFAVPAVPAVAAVVPDKTSPLLIYKVNTAMNAVVMEQLLA